MRAWNLARICLSLLRVTFVFFFLRAASGTGDDGGSTAARPHEDGEPHPAQPASASPREGGTGFPERVTSTLGARRLRRTGHGDVEYYRPGSVDLAEWCAFLGLCGCVVRAGFHLVIRLLFFFLSSAFVYFFVSLSLSLCGAG